MAISITKLLCKQTLLNSLLFYSVFLSIILASINTAIPKEILDKKLVRLATTTSTENSGLLAYLLPQFKKDTGYNIHTIAVGTGKALRMGRDGDVDVLLVHALEAENKFVANGHGVERFAVMMNDFVIVGSQNDPAKLFGAKSAVEALQKIATTTSKFISRGDNSGTHKKELSLWESANYSPIKSDSDWYIEIGQGMGKVLQMAGEMDAYTMTDRGTWLAYEAKSLLTIAFEGDSKLFNPYGIIAVNPKKYPDLNSEGANAFIHWIISDKGQQMIGQFKIAGKVLFKPANSLQASMHIAVTN